MVVEIAANLAVITFNSGSKALKEVDYRPRYDLMRESTIDSCCKPSIHTLHRQGPCCGTIATTMNSK